MHRLKAPRSWISVLVLVAVLVLMGFGTASAAPPGGPPPVGTGGCDQNNPDPSCTGEVYGPGSGGVVGAPVGGGNDGGHGWIDPYAYPHYFACSGGTPIPPPGVNPATWLAALIPACLAAVPGGPPPPPSPAVLAEEALATIYFPHPSGHRSPDETNLFQGYAFTWVHLWTFWWTDPGTWRTLSATASLRGVTVTVTATPTSLSYDPGDGSPSVSCAGPGRPWVDSDGYDPPSGGACGYQYRQVTNGPITATQTLTWKVTWTGTGGSGGDLQEISTSTSGQLQVLQIQVVNR
jgi:hypothetical protein